MERAARRAQARKEKARTTRRVGERAQAREKAPRPRTHADRVLLLPRKGHIKEECRIRMADERDSKNKDEKDKRKDKRFRQMEKKQVNALDGRGQGNQGTSSSSTSQGEVQATVGALQARMIFAVRIIAIVKRGRSVLHSRAGHWIVDGTLEPPSQTTAIKLRTPQANNYLEFDEILKQDGTDDAIRCECCSRAVRISSQAST